MAEGMMTLSLWMTLGAAAAATVSDMRSRRIPNWLTVPLLAGGLIGHVLMGGWPEGLAAAGGAALPLVLLPVYGLGILGAGDLKLLMGMGAWLGFKGALELTVLAVLWGGLISALLLLGRPEGPAAVRQALRHLGSCAGSGKLLRYPVATTQMPFALAILCAVLMLWLQHAGLIPAVSAW